MGLDEAIVHRLLTGYARNALSLGIFMLISRNVEVFDVFFCYTGRAEGGNLVGTLCYILPYVYCNVLYALP